MTLALLLAGAALAVIAAGGVLRPFARPREVTLERLADPLEDERLSLLRSIRDLKDERASGVIGEEDYRTLRNETETRAVAVLRALEARDGGGQLAAGLKEFRAPSGRVRTLPAEPSANGEGISPPPHGGRWLPAAVVGGVCLAIVVPLLIVSVGNRGANQSITGSGPGQSGLAFLQRRVAEHPQDLAAHLDLAQAYLDSGEINDAVQQYEAALAIDPNDPEARARLGFVLYLGGKPGVGLRAVNQALAVSPDDPEALYFKGIILLRGLNRPAEARAAFQDYLLAAPFGEHRDQVQDLLKEAGRSG
jgi:tetratricopeptide (TPR) repeat protein